MQQGIASRIAFLAALLASTSVMVACSESQAPDCGGLTVTDAWVRVAPEGAEVMGAYLSLENEGEAGVSIVSVSSSQFDRAEMHQTVVNDNGQASMQPLEQVLVPAGEHVDFKPGGRHVMLFGPTQTYAAGDQVELILSCGSQSAELPVAATVRAEQPGAAGPSDMRHGSDQEMAGGAEHNQHTDQPADDAGAAEDSATADR